MSFPKTVGIETEYGIVAHASAPSAAAGGAEAQTAFYPDPVRVCRILLDQLKTLDLITVPHVDAHYPVAGDSNASGAPKAPLLVELDSPDEPSFGMYDRMLANGSRLYIDHAHPEYSTPECLSARTLVAADKAGEIVLERCCEAVMANKALPTGQKLSLYKNNSDHKGSSYGCHENYLLSRDLYENLLSHQPRLVTSHLLPFLVTRSIFCGAGKVGGENNAPPAGFQLSQRADFFETLVGPQTTYCRPLFNTRDEAHADPSQHRRLHVITGDANMAELSTYLKVGTMLILFRMMEDGFLAKEDFSLADPLVEFRSVSRDLTFRRKLSFLDGRELTAVEIQKKYLGLARRYLKKAGANSEERDVVAHWSEVLKALEQDWRQLASSLDWAIKRNLLERYLSAQGTTWDEVERWEPSLELILQAELRLAAGRAGSAARVPWGPESVETPPRWRETVNDALRNDGLHPDDYPRQRTVYFGLRRLDLQYHDIRRGPSDEEAGLFYRLQKRNVIRRIMSDEEIYALIEEPPEGTRAWFRGNLLKRFSRAVAWADWSCMRLSNPPSTGEPGRMINLASPTSDYAADAKALWGDLAAQYGADGAATSGLPAEQIAEHSDGRNKKDSQAAPDPVKKAGRGGVAKKVARGSKATKSGTTRQHRKRYRD